jgi:hypothetical protein
VIDKVGRRALLMFAGIGMSGSCMVLGAVAVLLHIQARVDIFFT